MVYPKSIEKRVMSELPFMATENIMMSAVKRGGNRQDLHERIREHSITAGKRVKEEGLDNNMVDLIAADPMFGLTKEEILAEMDPKAYIGRAPQQVEDFIKNDVMPRIEKYLADDNIQVEINL